MSNSLSSCEQVHKGTPIPMQLAIACHLTYLSVYHIDYHCLCIPHLLHSTLAPERFTRRFSEILFKNMALAVTLELCLLQAWILTGSPFELKQMSLHICSHQMRKSHDYAILFCHI